MFDEDDGSQESIVSACIFDSWWNWRPTGRA